MKTNNLLKLSLLALLSVTTTFPMNHQSIPQDEILAAAMLASSCPISPSFSTPAS